MTTSYKSKAPTESTENLIVRKQSPASSPANPDATQTCVVYEQVGNIFSVKQLTALERARKPTSTPPSPKSAHLYH
ncbi:hypothetical protein GLAREA_09540 [Glarea lozoyensis ATCC 20868]|uniref:Uncharacterized protein n=1 Tax=Glarea lozoyensis (strain ATCC 20868 / MF5171) TaxID=1116229 RepID=S3CRX0_GLAL2|nr:uncharacterized protein GLAREA_09540 [Glarea lozoyensis ATCC 20868]EPE28420.1 hypothetical protein GLAREA_09540 [Glarea lozoyensis ATCC 20868]